MCGNPTKGTAKGVEKESSEHSMTKSIQALWRENT